MVRLTSRVSLLVALLLPFQAFSHCMTHKYYAGGGLALNSYPGYDNATGFQVFAGYCLDFNFKNPKTKTSVELGYMDSGDFERSFNRFGNNPNRAPQLITETQSYDGVWLAGLGEYKVDTRVHLLGRLGLDFGGDQGLIAGAGFAFNLSKFAQIRTEYVIRNDVDSVQMNFITEF